ncbi:MAG: glycosyltransferase family 1 protein [Bacteroidia bacterium]
MKENCVHIISFNVPYPANYGGVIDVFYKLKKLHGAGVKIILHCFIYDRPQAKELENYCHKIFYYKRNTGLLSALSIKPYIVQSRNNKELLNNLLKDKFPIVFEGLHSCYFINHPLLKNRKKIYRESNIEHHYYYHLFKAEKNLFKKIYFIIEAAKLYLFQNELKFADEIIVVSKQDAYYLSEKFPGRAIKFIPSFHAFDKLTFSSENENYVLYHGNFSVAENALAAHYLIDNVFSKLPYYKFILTGLNPSKDLVNKVAKFSNIELIANPDDNKMKAFITKASINILITFQATGLKLKLLNVLFNGKHCIVNSKMLAGTDLHKACIIAENPDEMIHAIEQYMQIPFTENDLLKRENLLTDYKNEEKTKAFLKVLFD